FRVAVTGGKRFLQRRLEGEVINDDVLGRDAVGLEPVRAVRALPLRPRLERLAKPVVAIAVMRGKGSKIIFRSLLERFLSRLGMDNEHAVHLPVIVPRIGAVVCAVVLELTKFAVFSRLL